MYGCSYDASMGRGKEGSTLKGRFSFHYFLIKPKISTTMLERFSSSAKFDSNFALQNLTPNLNNQILLLQFLRNPLILRDLKKSKKFTRISKEYPE